MKIKKLEKKVLLKNGLVVDFDNRDFIKKDILIID